MATTKKATKEVKKVEPKKAEVKKEMSLDELRSELSTLRLDVAMGKEKNSAQIKKLRKQIARLLTKQNVG